MREAPFISNLEREWRLRLFPQLHQVDESEWHRANGELRCEHCQLPYKDHPNEEILNIDHRLCSGVTVHL